MKNENATKLSQLDLRAFLQSSIKYLSTYPVWLYRTHLYWLTRQNLSCAFIIDIKIKLITLADSRRKHQGCARFPEILQYLVSTRFCAVCAYSNFTFCGGWTPSFFEFTWKMSKFQQNEHTPETPPLGQISFIFMWFWGNNWPKISFSCPPLELAYSLWEILDPPLHHFNTF